MGFAGLGRLPGGGQTWILGGMAYWAESLPTDFSLECRLCVFLSFLISSCPRELRAHLGRKEQKLGSLDIKALKFEQALEGDMEGGELFSPFIPAKYFLRQSPS